MWASEFGVEMWRVGISATPPAASKYGVEICHVRMELERDPLYPLSG